MKTQLLQLKTQNQMLDYILTKQIHFVETLTFIILES